MCSIPVLHRPRHWHTVSDNFCKGAIDNSYFSFMHLLLEYEISYMHKTKTYDMRKIMHQIKASNIIHSILCNSRIIKNSVKKLVGNT